jgi:excisionase family DNA binding protein
MTVQINGRLFFTTAETCKKVGISRATLVRWLQKGILPTIRRDRRGFKLFTREDIQILKSEVQKIHVEKIKLPSGRSK